MPFLPRPLRRPLAGLSLFALCATGATWAGCGLDTAGLGGTSLGDASFDDTAVDVAVDAPTDVPSDAPTCSDGLKNGDETDFDCGGTRCGPCTAGRHCLIALDCETSLCVGGVCVGPGCTNGAKDGKETDLDCGGGSCAPCADGKKCAGNGDCANGYCNGALVCAAPTCSDAAKNQTETDVDCGGSSGCQKCVNGKKCVAGADCQSAFCNASQVCATPSCTDLAKNQTETDVDCGGSSGCPKCADGKKCAGAGDCANAFCNVSSTCATPSCSDGAKNQTETDVDCGGSSGCPKCVDGKKCTGAGDCANGFCNPTTTSCATPTCGDGFKNGAETDVDCGGGKCSLCSAGKACGVHGDCATSWCSAGVCRRAISCKALLAAVSGLPSGVYEVDPDGAGPNSPATVYCDMTTDGGGWTLVAHVDATYPGGDFLEKRAGTYRGDRVDDGTTYSLGDWLLPYVGHTQAMVTLDGADIAAATAASKLVVYQYAAGAPGFNRGPIPCLGLLSGFSYRLGFSGAWLDGGTGGTCDTTHWYSGTPPAQLVGFASVVSANGAWWGAGMGGNSTWSHDAYWYVR